VLIALTIDRRTNWPPTGPGNMVLCVDVSEAHNERR